jgi:hypothetical protein
MPFLHDWVSSSSTSWVDSRANCAAVSTENARSKFMLTRVQKICCYIIPVGLGEFSGFRKTAFTAVPRFVTALSSQTWRAMRVEQISVSRVKRTPDHKGGWEWNSGNAVGVTKWLWARASSFKKNARALSARAFLSPTMILEFWRQLDT